MPRDRGLVGEVWPGQRNREESFEDFSAGCRNQPSSSSWADAVRAVHAGGAPSRLLQTSFSTSKGKGVEGPVLQSNGTGLSRNHNRQPPRKEASPREQG